MEKNLKILMISSDRKLLESRSAVSERMKAYGALVEELHIILLSAKSHRLANKQIGNNIRVYPTNSFLDLLRPLDAARLGKKIVFESKFVRGESLITAQDPFECGWAAARVKQRWRLPLEIQLHTDHFSPYFTGFQNRVRKFFARTIIANADSIRVVSEDLKLKVQSLGLKAVISVLPIYVDKEKIENAPISFDLHARFGWQFVLLTVSRLTREKNLPLALRVLSLLRQRYPNAGLVIVGSGPEAGELKELTRELKVEKNVVFEGWQENLASYYKTANAYIQTSRFEGYGMSLVEAGLSGLPVVTTAVGVATDMENGKDLYLCPQDDAGYFANAIADLIDNNQHRETLKINMKNFLETHLLSKSDYLNRLKKNWEETAKLVS